MGGDPTISRRHFSLTYSSADRKVILQDSRYMSGTYLVYPDGKERIYGPVQLHDGMVIGVADKDFRFEKTGK